MKFIFSFSILLILTGCFNNDKISFTEESLAEKISVLASDDFEGRLAGATGYMKAIDYSERIFEEAYLTRFNSEGFRQHFNVECNEIIGEASVTLFTDKNKPIEMELGKDYSFRGFTGSGNFSSDVVFCGYGISQSDYDDYADIDVTGKTVMIFKQNPGWKINDSPWKYSLPREKSIVAKNHGAKGIIFVSRPNDENPQRPIGSVLHGKGDHPVDFPQVQIDIPYADMLFDGTKHSLKELQTTIDKHQKPRSILCNGKIKFNIKADYDPSKETCNLIGIHEGSDDSLKNEYVIVGAHLDHVGKQGKVIYNGANDNASGSAVILELAEMLGRKNLKTKRSIMFVLFSSEESGLEGAKYLAENLNTSPANISAMINLDCVGYGDSIKIGCGKSFPKLWSMINEIDRQNDKMMIKETWQGGGADATPFYELGIPTAYFVTTNSYDHLHLPTDKAETLNYKLLSKVTKLAFNTIKAIANNEYKREIENKR